MPKFKLEEFLLPHEHDGEGKKLETPKELDVEQLRKWAYALLTDKEEAQEARDTAITERENIKNDLEELQRKNETDEQRRAREQQERDKEFEKLQKREREREKVEAIESAFEKQGITPGQAKRLAKRVSGDDAKSWVDDAKELVEDGFKIGTSKAEGEGNEANETPGDDLRGKPRRSDGRAPVTTDVNDAKIRSVGEELDAAGIGRSGW